LGKLPVYSARGGTTAITLCPAARLLYAGNRYLLLQDCTITANPISHIAFLNHFIGCNINKISKILRLELSGRSPTQRKQNASLIE
jgi:hypothetical protein